MPNRCKLNPNKNLYTTGVVMSEEKQSTEAAEENSATTVTAIAKREKRIKTILILLIVAAMVGVYFYQQRGLTIKGWSEDLRAALAQAKQENRPVVIMFANKSQTPTARTLRKHINRPSNKKALEQGKYITVMVYLDNAFDSDLAKKYKIESLPTLLLLNPDGTEHNRGVGNIGETPFRDTFLNYNQPKTK